MNLPASFDHEALLADIEAVSCLRTFVRKQLLVRPGAIARHLYYIKHGAVRQYYLREEREIVFRLGIEHEFCAASHSLITGLPAFDIIEAVEETQVLEINYPALCALYQTNIQLANFARQLTEQYFVQEQERTLSLTRNSPRQRYQDFLTHQAAYLPRFSLGTIASYLGMSQETLSRIRSRRF